MKGLPKRNLVLFLLQSNLSDGHVLELCDLSSLSLFCEIKRETFTVVTR